jgi:shikimate kinase
MKRNIVLVGFMGSGKSMTSDKLAGLLKREVLSTDTLIERKEGKTIAEIFCDSGEAYFRQVEKDVVKEVSRREDVIIDCGGGVVLDRDNVVELKKNGMLFYLSASPESIYENIKGRKDRPLLNVPDPLARIAELLDARAVYYEQADCVIDADYKTIDRLAEDIMKVLNNE